MNLEPFDFFFQEAQSWDHIQAFTLTVYTIEHNDFIQVVLIEAEETLKSSDRLMIPDPYTFLLLEQERPKGERSKQAIFLPLYYMELKKNTERDYLSYVKNKDISLKDRDMTLFENALKRPLSIQLAKQTVFLYNMLRDGSKIKKMPLFLLTNLEALLKALETIVTNREYRSFGINQIPNQIPGIRKFDPVNLRNREEVRTKNLIGLLNYIIPQVYTTWKIDEKELDDFQTQYHELFCYDAADILPLTYITSFFLTTIRSFIRDSVWFPDSTYFINSVWKWD